MTGYSKFAGYFTLSILLIVFVSWTKYSFVPDAVVWAVAIGTCAFFAGWRAFTGIWPGNDAPQ